MDSYRPWPLPLVITPSALCGGLTGACSCHYWLLNLKSEVRVVEMSTEQRVGWDSNQVSSWSIWTLSNFLNSSLPVLEGHPSVALTQMTSVGPSFQRTHRDSSSSAGCGQAAKNLMKLFMRSSWAEFNPSERQLSGFEDVASVLQFGLWCPR